MIPTRWRWGLSCMWLVSCMYCLACTKANAPQQPLNIRNASSSFTQRAELRGGDSQAWPTARGNAGDAGYCRARLKLPLARQPAWTHEYTRAAFSAQAPSDIVSYDGLVVVGALCSQLLGLNAASGSLVFQRDLYKHLDEDRVSESLTSLFIHPQGLLTGRDDLGRYYCWDLLQLTPKGPRQLWISAEYGPHDAGCVTYGSSLVTSINGSIRQLAVENGRPGWEFPSLLPSGGIVCSEDEIAVWWSEVGEIVALDMHSGTQLWKTSLATRPRWVAIDDLREAVLIIRDDEQLDYRHIGTGQVLWSYNWSGLLADAERQRLAELRDYERVRLQASSPMITPEAIYLPLYSGYVLKLDPDGKLLWQIHRPTTLLGGLAFDNALLVGELYLGSNYLASPVFGPFTAEPPDWELYAAADETQRANGLFYRFAVIDTVDGGLLDALEMSSLPAPSPTPAGKMVVFGLQPTAAQQNRQICAYDWIEGGAD